MIADGYQTTGDNEDGPGEGGFAPTGDEAGSPGGAS